MIIGLLLYVLAFVLLSMAQLLKKDIFQKLILPVFFSISKLKLLLFLCLQFTVNSFSFNFSLLCFGQVEKLAVLQCLSGSFSVRFRKSC